MRAAPGTGGRAGSARRWLLGALLAVLLLEQWRLPATCRRARGQLHRRPHSLARRLTSPKTALGVQGASWVYRWAHDWFWPASDRKSANGSCAASGAAEPARCNASRPIEASRAA